MKALWLGVHTFSGYYLYILIEWLYIVIVLIYSYPKMKQLLHDPYLKMSDLVIFFFLFFIYISGHFLPLFAVHAFCNHIGLPEVKEMLKAPSPTRNKLMVFHVLGLVTWYFLLYPLTEPSIYSNGSVVL